MVVRWSVVKQIFVPVSEVVVDEVFVFLRIPGVLALNVFDSSTAEFVADRLAGLVDVYIGSIDLSALAFEVISLALIQYDIVFCIVVLCMYDGKN